MRLIAASAAVCLLLVGCAAESDRATGSPDVSPTEAASSTAASPTASPTASGTPVASPAPVVIEVAQVAGTVTPPPSRVQVPVGSPVRLIVRSDVADEIHVHGYEVEAAVTAGGSVTVDFVADQAGLFEVETHETALQLLQLQVS